MVIDEPDLRHRQFNCSKSSVQIIEELIYQGPPTKNPIPFPSAGCYSKIYFYIIYRQCKQVSEKISTMTLKTHHHLFKDIPVALITGKKSVGTFKCELENNNKDIQSKFLINELSTLQFEYFPLDTKCRYQLVVVGKKFVTINITTPL